MAVLNFRLVTQQVETIQFDCGVDSINEYVKNSYYPLITQQAYTYSISSDDKVLGFYQILFREILLKDFPDDISEYDSGIKNETITAAHIRYIAIDKEYHRNGIGTVALRSIIKSIYDFSVSWPIRVIQIDARTDLVDWYRREGFQVMKNNTEGQDGTTVSMFFDCMRYSNELKTYLDEQFM